MSLMRRRGGGRRKVATVLTTAGALLGFQTLAVIGAVPALAVSGCNYNPATDTINITIDPGEAASVAVETAADLDPESPPGAILFSASDVGGGFLDYDNGADSTQCGSASTSNTVAIIVLGQPSNDETFLIDEWNGGAFPNTIAWAVDLGSNTAAGDWFEWWGSDDSGSDLGKDDTVVLTDTSFDLNGAQGELVGVENHYLYGGDGDDTLDGKALTKYFEADGADDNDWIAPGSFAGDFVDGDDGVGTPDGDADQLSYATRTTPTVIDNSLGESGQDTNGNGDACDAAADECDGHANFEVLETGSGNDTLIGASGVDETFIPGDGDDDVTGDAADFDVLDWSSSSAAMSIDSVNGEATGQGTDTWTGVSNFVGSSFDDTLLVGGGATPGGAVDGFSGGDGADTVDASGAASGAAINLETLDDPFNGATGPDDVENAVGSAFNDTLTGNDLRNVLSSGDGDDSLSGAAGNDRLLGGLGNDTYSGGTGADTVSFENSPAGIDADLLAGFATGEGDDSFTTPVDVEIIAGSSHDDTITGGGGVVATNFRFNGRGGDDVLTGSGSNDTLRGGGGRDVLRGVNGDDTLVGGNGNDRLFGGPGVDVGKGGKGKDVCKGVEIKSSCGTKKNPKAPVTRQRL